MQESKITNFLGDELDLEEKIAYLIFDGPYGADKADKLTTLLRTYKSKIVDELERSGRLIP